ncbi:hypothetical protein SDC9_185475 [bioreactor metagenome]|uniref:Uncharacterized protein n=1 Tax=bioreactor metagenome TaxID=1076179 RepID=A0A645HPA0_9ZZZZ
MHLTPFVVCRRVLLKPFSYRPVGDHNLPLVIGLHCQFEDIQQFAGITTRETEQCVGLL